MRTPAPIPHTLGAFTITKTPINNDESTFRFDVSQVLQSQSQSQSHSQSQSPSTQDSIASISSSIDNSGITGGNLKCK